MITSNIKDIKFKNPILVASGTYGYGNEVKDIAEVELLGGIVTKSVTLNPREGNKPPRIFETSSGMLNSIGLANVGVENFCNDKIPYLNQLNTNIIVNIAGSSIGDYLETLDILEESKGNQIEIQYKKVNNYESEGIYHTLIAKYSDPDLNLFPNVSSLFNHYHL